jgi:hypothetical protein
MTTLKRHSSELAYIANQRGYKAGWASLRSITPHEPSPEVLLWVRSRNIAWAKAQQKLRAQQEQPR